MTKTEQLEELFKEWQNEQVNKEKEEEYNEYHKKGKAELGYIPQDSFIYDGILFEDEFENTKILFVGKESNEYDYDKTNHSHIYLTDEHFWVKNQVKDYFEKKKPVGGFVLGLAKLANAIVNNDYDTPNNDLSVLLGIAFINLNKRGGYNYCEQKTLEGYVNRYKQRIKEQIEYIEPNIIVCCGKAVYSLVNSLELFESNNVICAYHPSYRRSDVVKLAYLKSQIEMKKETVCI